MNQTANLAPPTDTVVFPSKVDAWLAVVIVASAVISLGAATALLMVEAPGRWLWAGLLVLLGAVLPLWLMRSTRYTLSGKELKVVSGPFRWRVPLGEIRSVTPTRNPLSSPALSLDRLRIEYGRKDWIMVSPRDPQAFGRELQKRRVLHIGD